MKVTKFSPDGLPLPLAGWSTGYQSIGSNTDSNPPLSALNFVQRITSNTSNTLLNPIVNFASGSGIAFAAASNTLTISATGAAAGGGGATISAGSNSTNVREISTAGASTTLWSPFDHAHGGISEVTASSSNTLQRGTLNLRAGTGIALALSDADSDGEFDTATIINTVGASSGGSGGSGYSLSVPSVTVGVATNGLNTTNPAVTIAAQASGTRLIVAANLVGRASTSVTCTNVTFTAMAQVQNGAGSRYDIWCGVATGTTGTTVTVNTGSSNFASLVVMAVADTLTPTAGSVTSGLMIDQMMLQRTGVTAGTFFAYFIGCDNTTNPVYFVPAIPGRLVNGNVNGSGSALFCGYAPTTGPIGGSVINQTSSTPFAVVVPIT